MSEKPFEVVLATSNPGKVRELQAMLEPLNWQVSPQSNWSFDDAEETAVTFVENALIKARHAALQTGLAAIADDSGLAVDALAGAPGVYSARYAGVNASDSDNVQKLLNAMRDVPAAERQAQFHCVLVFVRHANDPTPIICHGRWQGLVHHQVQGTQGFGYDPIFWLAEQQCTAAELRREQKQQLSHRGQALAQLLTQLTAR
ncbi:RdgB/HAM1 family non-canonical purine NTP pyrophosphatase [Idiomarina xiamenensis]|uniref:dITP/XTP pyrophosphatase n=1 Tax=Idiomarina xiamenensis 10-D-4 TaxID=740709 RepID=K2K7U2_9GAMM|nr:RdgB/HAM1 family non-canonical purine NTP pyrophosphatase [Idiomarina xiamenensis]EKE83728.1 dITP/XTP pyrophosphatase [Idiomarina xiamenensis 10-D-4]